MREERGRGGIRLCGRFVGGGLLIELFDRRRLCWELSWCLCCKEKLRLVCGLFDDR